MALFVTSIELREGTEQDYETLHGFMAEAEFKRSITDDGGTSYKLPRGTYSSISDTLDATQMRDQARAAAVKTGRKYWIVTTMGPSAWTSERVGVATG